MKSRLFRIEHHTNQLGPYYYMDNPKLKKILENTYKYPIPVNDEITSKSHTIKDVALAYHLKTALTGFRDITQMRKWFSQEQLRYLHDFGFVMSLYETSRDNLVKLKQQACILDKKQAEFVFSQSLLHFIY